MPVLTTAIALGGLALGAIGTGMSIYGSSKAAAAQQQQLALQQQEEAQRKAAMELDATRRKREMVRQSIAQRSLALATTTNQGAAQGSGLMGAYGGISGRSNVNELGVNQNLEIGRNLFGLKAQESTVSSQIAGWNSFSGIGSGLSSLGGGLVKNLDAINRVGTTVSGWYNPLPYQGTPAYGS